MPNKRNQNQKPKIIMLRPQQRPRNTRMITPSGDPPAVLGTVWRRITKYISLTLSSTPSTVKINDLTASLTTLRLTSLSVWADPGLGALSVELRDPIQDTNFNTVRDNGTYSTRPRAGIAYSDAIRNTPVSSADTIVLANITSPTTGNAIVQVHFWQQFTV